MNSGIKNMNFFHVRNIEGQNSSEHTVYDQSANWSMTDLETKIVKIKILTMKSSFFFSFSSVMFVT